MYADDTTVYFNPKDFNSVTMNDDINSCLDKINVWLNPIRSGGGGFKIPPPQFFYPHAFNFGATLLCFGDFSQK